MQNFLPLWFSNVFSYKSVMQKIFPNCLMTPSQFYLLYIVEGCTKEIILVMFLKMYLTPLFILFLYFFYQQLAISHQPRTTSYEPRAMSYGPRAMSYLSHPHFPRSLRPPSCWADHLLTFLLSSFLASLPPHLLTVLKHALLLLITANFKIGSHLNFLFLRISCPK